MFSRLCFNACHSIVGLFHSFKHYTICTQKEASSWPEFTPWNLFVPRLEVRTPHLLDSDGSVRADVVARGADEDLEVAGLNDILHLDVPQSPVDDGQVDVDGLGLAGLDQDLGESTQLLVGDNDGADDVLDVDLDDLLAVARRVVGHVDGNCDGIGR